MVFVVIRVDVVREVYQVFDYFRQTGAKDREAFGILIGTHSIDEKIIKIKIATKPGRGDRRTRFSYEMKSKHHMGILKKAFKNSNSEEVYLGTWHSHPEAEPNPSKLDIKDWKKQYRSNAHLFDKMIFVIVGIKKIKWWRIVKGKIKYGGEI